MNNYLEQITERQRTIINDMLFHVINQCIDKSRNETTELVRRQEQAQNLFHQVYSRDAKWPETRITEAAEIWYDDERSWSKCYPDEDVAEALLYRLLIAFLRNHVGVPFTKEQFKLIGKNKVVTDASDFEELSSRTFNEFCQQLVTPVRRHDLPGLKPLKDPLMALTATNLDKEIYSARYKLMAKDFDFLKSVFLGGTAGVGASIFLGPVIGTWIGNVAGLSGAAATSYGLALLGGGSLASGGFGMLGGSIVLGVAVGTVKGSYDGMRVTDVDLLNLNIACRNLPILLSTGRILKELGYKKIPMDLKKLILNRHKENKDRLESLNRDANDYKSRVPRVKATVKMYKKALGMAQDYDWMSGYDICKKVF